MSAKARQGKRITFWSSPVRIHYPDGWSWVGVVLRKGTEKRFALVLGFEGVGN